MDDCQKKYLPQNGILWNGLWFCSNLCCEAFEKAHPLSRDIFNYRG